MAVSPLPNDGVTIACPICGHTFVPVGRQRYCSDVCRQAAWRRRQPTAPSVVPPPAPSQVALTVYECPACEVRLYGQQRCPDCQIFARRLGLGGLCPHCDEPVTLVDLGFEATPGSYSVTFTPFPRPP